jgi:ATP-dependent helicase HepA
VNTVEDNINSLLHKLTVELVTYLEKILSSFFDDRWTQAVVNKLSFQQRRWLEQRNIDSLESLAGY